MVVIGIVLVSVLPMVGGSRPALALRKAPAEELACRGGADDRAAMSCRGATSAANA